MSSNNAILEGRNLSVCYGARPALRDVDVSLHQGELLCVVGPNGSGKSTLVKALTGVVALRGGQVRLGGKPLSDYSRTHLAQRMAVVPQSMAMFFSFTVRQMVEMGRYPFTGLLETLLPSDRERVAEAMELAGIADLSSRRADCLSGGELQRVILARALAQRSTVLLLDEPMVHLDPGRQVQMFELLASLAQKENLGIFCVSHDLNLAAHYAHRMIMLYAGSIYAGGDPAEVLQEDHLRQVYGLVTRVMPHPHTLRPMILLPGSRVINRSDKEMV
jgi:iron complex transport system ATP-binding protein